MSAVGVIDFIDKWFNLFKLDGNVCKFTKTDKDVDGEFAFNLQGTCPDLMGKPVQLGNGGIRGGTNVKNFFSKNYNF